MPVLILVFFSSHLIIYSATFGKKKGILRQFILIKEKKKNLHQFFPTQLPVHTSIKKETSNLVI